MAPCEQDGSLSEDNRRRMLDSINLYIGARNIVITFDSEARVWLAIAEVPDYKARL